MQAAQHPVQRGDQSGELGVADRDREPGGKVAGADPLASSVMRVTLRRARPVRSQASATIATTTAEPGHEQPDELVGGRVEPLGVQRHHQGAGARRSGAARGQREGDAERGEVDVRPLQ